LRDRPRTIIPDVEFGSQTVRREIRVPANQLPPFRMLELSNQSDMGGPVRKINKKLRRDLIPGSMGTRSYVVTGRGNPASFCSAPHGAGRNFSRSEARRRFTVEELADAMKGIEWRADNADAFPDEIPGADKDVDVVMADAVDLVSISGA
jgi:RNA-splicing ligase RtcB